MQNILFKIITIIIISLFSNVENAISQDLNYDLAIADSLFEKGKYTESYDIYNAILNTGEQFSAAMLLRMAYIKEGLGDHSNALYYLNRYYYKTSNKLALNKMEKLADAHELKGYSQKDKNILLHLFYKNFNRIVFFLSVIAFILLGISIYSKLKLKQTPYWSSLVLTILLCSIFYLVNFSRLDNRGIIIKQGAFIMSGPSSGANLIDSPQKGHKVKILDQEDVWLKIFWNGETGYIKSQFVKPLQF
ncbi:MAG: SH3 domain-containing protein [Cyclobacteriaceae bacterium]|nr:SH3 domain-containing protein [Cyclobacteriaceae bacterium]